MKSGAPAPPALEVAVTVDDLPTHGASFRGIDRVAIATKMLDAFAKHRMPPVYGFTNGKRVEEDPTSIEVLERWTRAGQPLGTLAEVTIDADDWAFNAPFGT